MSVSGDKFCSHVKAVSTFHYPLPLFSYAMTTHPGEKCSKMLGMVEVLRISTLKAHQVGRTHQPLHHGCAAAVSRTSWLLT